MKNEITTTEQINDTILIQHLDNAGLTSALSKPEKDTYLSICKAFNLNPFKREVHVTKYGSFPMAIVTGYETYIKRAERSGQLDGWNAVTSGSVDTNDLKATVTIYRKDRQHPFVWEAFYDECVQKTKEGKVTKFWEKANFMTKKVAISQGFRLCFSDELGGMPYTSDEMSEVTENIPHQEVKKEEEKELEVLSAKVLTDSQFEKCLTMDAEKLKLWIKAIEEGKYEATQVQVLALNNKLKSI